MRVAICLVLKWWHRFSWMWLSSFNIQFTRSFIPSCGKNVTGDRFMLSFDDSSSYDDDSNNKYGCLTPEWIESFVLVISMFVFSNYFVCLKSIEKKHCVCVDVVITFWYWLSWSRSPQIIPVIFFIHPFTPPHNCALVRNWECGPQIYPAYNCKLILRSLTSILMSTMFYIFQSSFNPPYKAFNLQGLLDLWVYRQVLDLWLK